MSDSLRDQLLKAGFTSKPSNEPRAGAKPRPQGGQPHATQARPRPQGGRPSGGKPRERAAHGAGAGQGEIDLARAYALRDRTEREQREREQREAEQRAKAKK